MNRLVFFHPWDDEIQSTSADIDETPLWMRSGPIPEGTLFAIALTSPYIFAICRRLKDDTKTKDQNMIPFQWLGNKTYNMANPIYPGWIASARNKSNNVEASFIVYAEKSTQTHKLPFQGQHANIEISRNDILIHSFQLTQGGRISTRVRRAIMDALPEDRQ